MTDTEINEAVARLLGWEEGPNNLWRRGLDDMPQHGLPNYCHSIAAAWEVVPYLTSKGGYLVVSVYEDHVKAEVEIWVNDNPIQTGALSETAPMSICLALLKLD